MHYFKIHIGDYSKKTGHLSPLEHGIYMLILHSYYDREEAPTLIEATRWARARTAEEKEAVLGVLDEFFTVNDSGRYIQNRVEEELDSYRAKAETNRVIAVAREEKKRTRKEQDRAPQEHGSCTIGQPNHKPLTTNQEPIQKVKTTVPPSGETADVFSYWQQKMNHPQAKLDAKRLKAIKARLGDGYTVGDLCEAIDGCLLSPHHMGQNNTRTVYDDIELICRDGPRVDKFIKLARQGGTTTSLENYMNELADWAAQK